MEEKTKPQILFFLGKGGVGKTTLSALSAKYFAFKNKSTTIYSFDAAHNLADIFKTKLADDLQPISEKLWAAEVDTEKWRTNYLNEAKRNIQANYSYLASYNYLDYFDILKFAPDIDSTALFMSFKTIIENSKHTVLIFDMPPTALSLQFFELIERNKIWLSHLIKLRKEIHKKKEIISKIKFGKRGIETDKVLFRLENLYKEYGLYEKLLKEANYINVQNPDVLSVLEAERINEKMLALGYSKIYSVINKQTTLSDLIHVNAFDKENAFENLNYLIEKNSKYFNWLDEL